jgi:hypothetical protein
VCIAQHSSDGLLQDVTAIRITTDNLMATLDEINTIVFVLLKVLVVTAPRKKQGCVSHEPLPALTDTTLAHQTTQDESCGWSEGVWKTVS